MPLAHPSSLADAADLIARRVLSPVELTRACLERIAAADADLRAFITVTAESALADAALAEREIAAGRYRGALHGIPVSLKDLVDVAGTPTTSGSAVPPRQPDRDAPVAANLRRAGAILVGKTNLHEFAFGTTSDETAFGAVRNPYDRSRSPGGSSGGAAVSIVEGMCYAAVGTDTGGSIRIPSAACGIVGLKPDVADLPTAGIVALSTTLDHVGPMARTVTDAALTYFAMLHGSAHPQDLHGVENGPVTLGVPGPHFLDRLDPEVRRLFGDARATLERAGHEVRDVAIEHAERTADVYLHIVLPEASWYHASLLERYADKYSPGVRLRLEMGRYVLAEDYVRAMQARAALRQAVDRALEHADALMLPALAIPAPPIGAASVEVDGAQEPVRAIMLRLTQLFNITGHPAIALPMGRGRDGLPRGLQLVGHRGGTGRLIAAAVVVERQLDGQEGP
jgi:aspartyl-tRNA(Asn)/glutamyl-tRNA(Gln) amidotransferase subunit A